LIVEPQRKRVQGVDGEFRGHYIRRQESVSDGQAIDPSSAASNPPSASNGSASFNGFPKRRLFQIRPLPHDSRSGRARGGSVATIVETRVCVGNIRIGFDKLKLIYNVNIRHRRKDTQHKVHLVKTISRHLHNRP
jgi:hypothetical protein